jgi:ssDNA-binding Zn-finger/Zn-ribbon topoisomerase 1
MALPPDTTQALLRQLVDHFDKEDRSVRERQILTWRRLKLFWEGFQQTWYSEVAHDWRIWDEATADDDTGQSYYDKPVNVFRAYLESIIAALSVTVPPVKCYPDDADDTLDLITAKAGDKISNLLYRHNDVPLLWLHSLFIFMTEGMVGCYCYPKEDKDYGEYEKKEYQDMDEQHRAVECPLCGYQLSEETLNDPLIEKGQQVQDKFMPDDSDVPVLDYMNNTAEQELCPACMQMMVPKINEQTLIVTRLVGITKEAKSRICMEAYGGLNIKVPNYARTQKDCPYLSFSRETNIVNALEKYDELDKSKLKRNILTSGEGPHDPYEEWGRLSPQYNGEYPDNVVTERSFWFRPAAYNILDKTERNVLRKKYPSGVKVVMVNDQFAEACNECMDDCWTLTYNPMSDYIHSDPLGLLLVSIQELTNDLISLIVQTIEHGIPQTFADPGVLNFDAYRQLEANPGGVYEATPKSGKSLADGFHEVKTATLSGEILPFLNQLQSLAQTVSGALPSLFGGQMAGGSGTASEYSMSRAQALQRLQNTWKMLTSWWKQIFGKAIPMYIEEVQDDIRDVQRSTDGNFINVFIRKAELEGKIGKVELEANENLPITWNQRKDVIMQLLNAGNPEILAMLGSAENLPIIREAIGLDGFFVPGEDQRDKQYEEIKLLLNSEPISMPPPMMGDPSQDPSMQQDPSMMGQLPQGQDPSQMGQPPMNDPNQQMNPQMGQPMEIPSVEVDPDYDDHQIHFDIVKSWVTGEAGRLAKVDNPEGYKNVLLHGKMHLMYIQQSAMAEQMANQGPNGANPEKPTKDTKAPIKGENDVPSVQ